MWVQLGDVYVTPCLFHHLVWAGDREYVVAPGVRARGGPSEFALLRCPRGKTPKIVDMWKAEYDDTFLLAFWRRVGSFSVVNCVLRKMRIDSNAYNLYCGIRLKESVPGYVLTTLSTDRPEEAVLWWVGVGNPSWTQPGLEDAESVIHEASELVAEIVREGLKAQARFVREG